MAVTSITFTEKGYNALDYVLSGNAHHSDRYVNSRIADETGLNCTVHGCRQQMNAVWKRYGINRPTRRHRRQILRLIQSFDPDQLNYKNPDDIAVANRIGCVTAKAIYPHHQIIVVTQIDGRGHCIHNHIIVNYLDYSSGRALHGKSTSWSYVQNVSDRIIKNYGLNPYRHKHMVLTINGKKPQSYIRKTKAEYYSETPENHGHPRYSWVADVRQRITNAGQTAISLKQYINRLNNQHVSVKAFTKKGRLRKYTSYSFVDQTGKTRHIRSRKLGYGYRPKHLMKIFQNNAKSRGHVRSLAPSSTASSLAKSTLKLTPQQSLSMKISSMANADDASLSSLKSTSPSIESAQFSSQRSQQNLPTVYNTMNILPSDESRIDFGAELDVTRHLSLPNVQHHWQRFPSNQTARHDRQIIRNNHNLDDHPIEILDRFFRHVGERSKKYWRKACREAKNYLYQKKIKFENWIRGINPKVDHKVHYIHPTVRHNIGTQPHSSKKFVNDLKQYLIHVNTPARKSWINPHQRQVDSSSETTSTSSKSNNSSIVSSSPGHVPDGDDGIPPLE